MNKARRFKPKRTRALKRKVRDARTSSCWLNSMVHDIRTLDFMDAVRYLLSATPTR